MEIRSPTSAPIIATKTGEVKILKNLISGQQLNAVVLNQLPEKGLVRLNIQGQILRAYSANPLTEGQTLLLEVARTGPIPRLKIIENQNIQSVIARNMRVLLPKQQSIKQFHKTLLNITQNGSNLSKLPPSIHTITRNLVQRLPNLEDVSEPANLKRAIQDSGITLEPKLNSPSPHARPTLNADLKVNLLRLLSLVNTLNRPPEPNNAILTLRSLTKDFSSENLLGVLRQRLQHSAKPQRLSMQGATTSTEANDLKTLVTSGEGALAKILVDQLASIPGDESLKQSWQLEIPFKHQDQLESVAIKMTREDEKTNHDDANEFNWTVELELNPPEIGSIHCKIKLHDGKVDAFFRSEHHDTTDAIKRNLSKLKSRLERAGVDLEHSSAVTRTTSPHKKDSFLAVCGLVDEKA